MIGIKFPRQTPIGRRKLQIREPVGLNRHSKVEIAWTGIAVYDLLEVIDFLSDSPLCKDESANLLKPTADPADRRLRAVKKGDGAVELSPSQTGV